MAKECSNCSEIGALCGGCENCDICGHGPGCDWGDEVKPARPTFKPGPPHPERFRLAMTRKAMRLTWQELADHLGCDASEAVTFEIGDLTLAITPDEYRDEIARCRLGLSSAR